MFDIPFSQTWCPGGSAVSGVGFGGGELSAAVSWGFELHPHLTTQDTARKHFKLKNYILERIMSFQSAKSHIT